MNRVKALLSIIILLITVTSISAQEASQAPKLKRTAEKSYNTLYISYDMPRMRALGDEDDDDYEFDSYNFDYGLTVGYDRGQRIFKRAHLYVEFGVLFSYASYSKVYNNPESLYLAYDYDNIDMQLLPEYPVNGDTKINYGYFSIPFGLKYNFFVKDKITISPFAGFNFRCGLFATQSVDCSLSSEAIANNTFDSEAELWEFVEGYSGISKSGTYNLFKEDYRDADSDDLLHRCSFGGQVGLDLSYGKYTIGVKHQMDMTLASDEYKFNSTSIRIGYKF